ncbi:hypothetical protein [Lysobacter gummosus]|uniref:hypothetical protein n=1 Tax=Lysobacter gummosus TaxID=262324 RepID=UPI0036259D4B
MFLWGVFRKRGRSPSPAGGRRWPEGPDEGRQIRGRPPKPSRLLRSDHPKTMQNRDARHRPRPFTTD